ncbi:pyrroline-5-carboxylate reductase [Mangrovivirga sp. M17]|uniref:Pyrroline-5-carboxylate reductase n=1 Tax=Mangrovivirga halotolerans TaxID=2993936 RepID=A0ABT3RSJ3_9BACT|nr:pyrroline-5-carboxylate reductase [Mangrovivirga halotolerans]MCX2744324.1 pyrroline-5-carboxylate reductase [Mangrovivirga halotolerans]
MNKILIYGGGNMGLVYAKTISEYYHAKDRVFIVEKREENLKKIKSLGFSCAKDIPENFYCYQYIILAVKPQDFPSIAPSLEKNIQENQWLISIMAGISCELIKENLNHKKIIRTMPNLAIPYKEGFTGFYISSKSLLTEVEKESVLELLTLGGKILEVEDENDLNAITALSGSGPAYFFYFVEQLQNAAISKGFSKDQAKMIALQTLKGALKVLENSEDTCETLIRKVSSRGGTTEAAFQVFNEKKLGENFIQGINRANERSEEFGKELKNFILNKLL